MSKIIKTFVASGAIPHRRLVKFTATDGLVAAASAATDKIAGVADCPGGAVDGQRIDVVLFGEASVDCGGTITPGAAITSDASGKAVAAAPAAGANATVAGKLLANAVSGDIALALVNTSSLQG